MLNHFLFAARFLTRLPLGANADYNAQNAAESVPYYAGVGLAIGVIVTSTAWILSEWIGIPGSVAGAIVVSVWVGITGALHLDGIADCADAWMGGGNNKERMLEILKDTSNGTGAIVALVLLLILKVGAVAMLIEQNQWFGLIIVPVAGRAAMMAVLWYFPYVRATGLGSQLRENLNFSAMVVSIGLVLILLVLHSVAALVIVLMACAISTGLLYLLLIRPLQGVTGDVYGAAVEVSEILILIGLLWLV